MEKNELLTGAMDGKTMTLALNGRVDSANASQFEEKALGFLTQMQPEQVRLDCSGLTYISSAGLRVLLKIKKRIPDFVLTSVNPEVYEILDVTGFSEMLKVEKAIREFSADGLPCIGRGATGSVYRINEEQIAKIFLPQVTLESVQKEQSMARKAFVAGIPACIPFEIIRCGDSYGIIYELIRSETLMERFRKDPDNTELIREYARLLKTVHSIPFAREGMGLAQSIAMGIQYRLKEDFTPEEMQRVLHLYTDLQDPGTFIHGDCHPGNVMVQNGELLFIDMTTSTSGNPLLDIVAVCDLYSRWNACSYEEARQHFDGLERDAAERICRQVLQAYYEADDQAKLDELLAYVDGMACLRMMIGARRFNLPWNVAELKARVLKAASMLLPALLQK